MGALLNPTKAGGPLFDPLRDKITGKQGIGAADVSNFVKPGGPLYDPVRDNLTSGGGSGTSQGAPATGQIAPRPAQALMGYAPAAQQGYAAPASSPGMSPGMVASIMSILGQNTGSTRPQDQI